MIAAVLRGTALLEFSWVVRAEWRKPLTWGFWLETGEGNRAMTSLEDRGTEG